MGVCGILLFMIATANAVAGGVDPGRPPWPARSQSSIKRCRQLLVVLTDSWPAQSGTMNLFERTNASSWQPRGATIAVRIGRGGLAWGRSIANTNSFAGPIKKEGDDKAPAGIFSLGSVFGLTAQTKMPFVALSKNTIAVNDPLSRYYNRIVDQSNIDYRDWRHAERLSGVDVYRLGVVVEHNLAAEPGLGSCIFLHIWNDSATSTSGCTAMSERALIRVIRWLDPAKGPLLVQLPRPVYKTIAAEWNLPPSASF
jgi:D-alanyl-D-alanine dipeptidase